ncbi:hypothetical protein NDU88_007421 [Pleurodeles waltl]|uniref:Uncharacterized protein n=1 Tax=Pleurodeles waltl TaxID=8319 RepID=A0AAV7SSG4_PLEWA|nr:hypothetical protein NDU88_007421 [Pleurodeles waltl]
MRFRYAYTIDLSGASPEPSLQAECKDFLESGEAPEGYAASSYPVAELEDHAAALVEPRLISCESHPQASQCITTRGIHEIRDAQTQAKART